MAAEAVEPRFHPEVLWAQRTDEIYVTINLSDIKDQNLEVIADKISFKATGGSEQKLYGFELQLFKEIIPDNTKKSQTARYVHLVLDKAEHGQSYWPRLQKEGGRVPFLKTDFSRWKDEDEDEDQDALGGSGMDFSSLMGDGGGMGGGGMDSDDSDEEIPDLETAEATPAVTDNTESMVVEQQKEGEESEPKP